MSAQIGSISFDSYQSSSAGTLGDGTLYQVMPSGGNVTMSPSHTGAGATLRNGAQVDPGFPNAFVDYDGRYSNNSGVVLDTDTVTVSPGQIVVKTVSNAREPLDDKGNPITTNRWRFGYLDEVAACAILAAPPTAPAGYTIFAPSILGGDERTFQLRSLDIAAEVQNRIMPHEVDVSGFSAAIPDVNYVMEVMRKPTSIVMQHTNTSSFNETGYEGLFPTSYLGLDRMNYGFNVGTFYNRMWQLLYSNATTLAEKEELLIRVIRQGLDFDLPTRALTKFGSNGGHWQFTQGQVLMARTAFGLPIDDFFTNNCGSWTLPFQYTAQSLAEMVDPDLQKTASLAYPGAKVPLWARPHTITEVNGNDITFGMRKILQYRIGLIGTTRIRRIGDGAQSGVIVNHSNNSNEGMVRTDTWDEPFETRTITVESQPTVTFQVGEKFVWELIEPLQVGDWDLGIPGSQDYLEKKWEAVLPGKNQQYKGGQPALFWPWWAADKFAGGLGPTFERIPRYALFAEDNPTKANKIVTNETSPLAWDLEFFAAIRPDITFPT